MSFSSFYVFFHVLLSLSGSLSLRFLVSFTSCVSHFQFIFSFPGSTMQPRTRRGSLCLGLKEYFSFFSLFQDRRCNRGPEEEADVLGSRIEQKVVNFFRFCDFPAVCIFFHVLLSLSGSLSLLQVLYLIFTLYSLFQDRR